MRSKSAQHCIGVRVSALGLACLLTFSQAAPREAANPDDETLPPQVARIDRNIQFQHLSIAIEFAEPMIPLGGGHDPDNPPPIRIEPELRCLWGWYGQARLECEYSEDLPPPPATRFTVFVDEELFTQRGDPVPPFRFDFETVRPQADSAQVFDWLSPTQPEISVQTNLPVRAASLAGHLRLLGPNGLIDELDVRIAERARLDSAKGDVGMDWIATPRKPLAAGTRYRVALDAGLETPDGELRGLAQGELGRFRTWGEFRVLGVVCEGLRASSGAGFDIHTLKLHHVGRNTACDPREPVPLVFSSPVAAESLADLLTPAALADQGVTIDQVTSPDAVAAVLLGQVPAGRSFAFELPKGFRDRFGRRLATSREVRFETLDFPPAARPVLPVAVIAQGSDNDLALQAVNAGRHFIDARIETATEQRHVSGWRDKEVPRRNQPYLVPLGIRALLAGGSGRVVGWAGLSERDSLNMIGRADLLPRREALRRHDALERRDLAFEAILTPFNIVVVDTWDPVVWITDIRTGAAIPGARVIRYSTTGDNGAHAPHRPCLSVERKTDSAGIAAFSHDDAIASDACDQEYIRVEQGNAVATLRLDFWFHSGQGDYDEHYTELPEGGVIVWGFTDKALYRPGKTVRYKLYVRTRSDQRLEVPQELSGYWIRDEGFPAPLVLDEEEVMLSEYGTHAGSFRLPDDIADGSYRITASRESWGHGGVDFLVATFQTQPYKVLAETGEALALAGERIAVSATAEYTAGGPYGGAAGQILAAIEPESFRIETAELYEFDFHWLDERASSDRGLRRTTEALRFDAGGKLDASALLPETEVEYGSLHLSVGARHENGAWVYSPGLSLAYARRPYFIGLRAPRWEAPAGKPIDIDVVAASPLGELEAGLEVSLELGRLDAPARAGSRSRQVSDRGYRTVETCALVSSGGIDTCSFAGVEPGEYRLTARLSDDGRPVDELVRQFNAFVIDMASGQRTSTHHAFAAILAESGVRLRMLLAERAYWEPSLRSDATGRVQVHFRLPDNLTRWRAVAVVSDRDGRMAMGSRPLYVTLPVEVRTELPAQLTAGDEFTARADVVNRQETPREVTLTVTADGTAVAEDDARSASRSFRAEPFLPRSLGLAVATERKGMIDVLALARTAAGGDALIRSVPVRGTIERRTLPMVGMLIDGRAKLPIASPGDAANPQARLEIGLSISVIGDLTDTFAYMRDYEHACWEQNLSRAVAASHREDLAAFVAPEVAYPASFVDNMLRTAGRFQTREGGMSFFQAEEPYVSDYLTAGRPAGRRHRRLLFL